MPHRVTEVEELQAYVRGVLRRADHHAPNVENILLAVAGAVVWRREGELEVRGQDGELKNVLWFHAGDHRYALAYNHHEGGAIELRADSVRGEVLASFSDQTPISEVKAVFAAL